MACDEHSAHRRAIAKHDDRLDSHSRQMDEMRECIVRLTVIEESAEEWRRDAEMRISKLEQAPAGNWDALVKAAISTVVGAVIGAVIASY